MRYALAALALSATAAQADCIHVESAFHGMEDNGYQITFSQEGDPLSFYLAQDMNGRWIAFIVEGEEACLVGRGSKGVNYPLPPNV